MTLARWSATTCACTMLALAAASPAQAQDLPAQAPASHAGADTMLRAALAVADTYWLTQGHAACPVELWVYTDGRDWAGARADPSGCRVWFERAYRDDTWATINDRGLRVRARRRDAYRLCGLAVHERGHNSGLEHSGSVLSVMWPGADRGVPWVCWEWAVRVVPKRKRPRVLAGHWTI